ncbi:MAG: hypothetical protein AAFP02_18240, partial [Bacteroidota bacterium]
LGRIVFSQDAGQAVEGRYSYVKFDNLGRVAEGGEVDYNDGASILAIAFDQQGSLLSITQYDQVWTAIGDVNTQPQSFHEVTQTIYDLPVANAPQALLDAFGGSQDNLHNRVAAIHYQDMDDDTRDMTQHFEYDIHGNVSTMVTEIPALAHLGHRFKTVDYEYDLLSGSVTEVHYQDGEADQFHHRYSYDADNRIQLVETSKDKVVWEEDAHYEFYQHGPLARVELGEDRVQGVDYAYTLQGWLKTINSNLLTPDRDMGHDNLAASGGTLTTPHEYFARDAFGFSIGYYEGDYSPIETPAIGAEFLADVSAHYANGTFSPLYNGNINHLASTLRNLDGTDAPQLTAYTYDQLHRLKTQRAFQGGNGNDWSTMTDNGDYFTALTYDADGNIETLTRNGIASSGHQEMDDLSYEYFRRDIGGGQTITTN